MAKSSEQDKAEGALYKVGGRVLQAIGSLTGDRKKKIKGRLGRGKGPSRIEKVASKIFLRNRREPTKNWAALLLTIDPNVLPCTRG